MSKFPLVQFQNPALQIIDGDRGSNYPQKSEFQGSGHCVFLNTGNVTAAGFDFAGVDFISEEKDSLLRKGKASRQDIVLTTRGTVGNVAFYGVAIPFENIRINSGMVLIRTDQKEIEPYYLYSFLRSTIFQKQVSSNGSGSAQPQLPINALKNIAFPLPDIDTQKKIAAVLSALDAKIDCNNRINAELEAMAKMLYDYWFVQFDFPDANGKPYKSSGGKMLYNATLKREIPAGWEDKQLCQIANITMGTSPTGDSLNHFGDGIEFFQGSTDFGWQFPTVRLYTTQPVRMAKRGDILLSVRAPVGDLNVAHIDCCIGRGLAALNSKNGFDGFLFYVMQYFKTIFDRRNTEGTTFGSITKDDLHSLPLACPANDLLKKYNDIVSGYNQMIFVRSMENQQLAQLRDWLLPLLMNGQVTVA